ncbi:hypothetical protein Nepgr_020022 [Nepenthes gracilis]|uniref:Clathrin/coatomer adaptor adaptin-like N-terminal domain-containing protein n=1 Tax=Nepenthes gracilis TaxID=150966 RepID=A0AAD3XVY4_NEPGR|nr:hypothetical protein Nepgr_020022 [Nepenthes gracilis]
MALLHQIRQNDGLAVRKLFTSRTRGTVCSPFAQCLIHYSSQVIRELGTNTQTGDGPFYDYLEGCLWHKAEMLFLSFSKPAIRFAAVRTLNKFTPVSGEIPEPHLDPQMSSAILHYLGIEGPKTADTHKYMWYIYNRVILENTTIRTAAVSTLAKFGAMIDSLKVCDRATLYLNTLGGKCEFLFGSLDVPLVNLETSLKNFEPSEEPFDIISVPMEIKSQPLAEKKAPGKKPTGLAAPPTAPTAGTDAFEKLLSSTPRLPVELTEAETEYAVMSSSTFVMDMLHSSTIALMQFQSNYRKMLPSLWMLQKLRNSPW